MNWTQAKAQAEQGLSVRRRDWPLDWTAFRDPKAALRLVTAVPEELDDGSFAGETTETVSDYTPSETDADASDWEIVNDTGEIWR